MVNIEIPNQHLLGIMRIQELTATEFQGLLEKLKEAEPSVARSRFVEREAIDIPGLSTSDATNSINALLWLASGQNQLQLGIDQFAEAVSQSENLTLDPDERKALAERLSQLLSIKPLRLTWKALDVLTQNERTFMEARILTDMRPIFGDDVSDPPDIVVILHTLKIRYRTGRRTEDLFLALDNNDIKELREVLDRAEMKAETLKSSLQTAGLAYLEVE